MGLRSSDQLWSRRQSIRRLRLIVTVLATICAIAVVVTTATDKLPNQLRIGGPLATVVALLAVVAPQLEQRLKQAQEMLTTTDQRLELEIERLAQRSRPDLLAQVRRYWVQSELEGSLQKLARIELGLAERPAAVDYALRALLRQPHNPDRPLRRGEPISEIYRELGKQLLILGEPGAGKTTLLLELAQQLLEQAETAPAEPMPVVFQLSTWALERPALATWLVDELHKRYGISRGLGQFWLNTEQVIPLLDGLDEVAPEHRSACMAAINDFHNAHGLLPLVVCSRIAEYEVLPAKLQLRGAIMIQPLTRKEVERYLWQAGRPLNGVRTILRDDEQLTELLTTPLFLSIVALAYRGKPAAAVRASGTLGERRSRMLADYVEAMFSRPRATPIRYSRQQTEAWLTRLAQGMRAHDQTLFYLDWMQPDWLPTQSHRRLVTVGVAVGTGAIAALVAWLPWALVLGPTHLVPLLLGPSSGLVVGLAAHESSIAPIERLRWSWAALGQNLPRSLLSGVILSVLMGLLLGLPIGILNALQGGLSGALRDALTIVLVAGVVFGPVFGLVAGLGRGLQPQPYETPSAPGKGMQTSMRSALISGLITVLLAVPLMVLIVFLLGELFSILLTGLSGDVGGGVGGGAIAGLFGGLGVCLGAAQRRLFLALFVGLVAALFVGLLFGPIFALTFWPIAGLVIGLQRGGGAYLRHLALRWLLSRDQLAPWDYVVFLELATGLILLRRRGGGYEFIHRLLLDYFASLEASSPARAQAASPSAAYVLCGQGVRQWAAGEL